LANVWGMGLSGGFLIDVYEAGTGIKIVPKHAMLYQAGNVAGIGVGLLLRLRSATWAATSLGPLKWVASVQLGLDVYGAGKATGNLYDSYQRNGKWEQEDAWNLLAYIPFIGAAVGVKKFFAFNKVASADNAVGAAVGNTLTEVRNCFVAGTEIQTIDGEKNIEDIQVGDWVLADDPNTPGEVEYKQVLDTFVHHTDKLVDLFVDGEVISTTGEHPFWTPDKGWVEAKDLVVGSLVMTEDGRVIDIDGVETRSGDFTVYNFSVEDFHSYFVSELGILVHNANYPDQPSRGKQFFPKGASIARDTFDNLQKEAGRNDMKKFIDALQKSIETGPVPPNNQAGIKVLSEEGYLGYTHELKINKSGGRLLGKFDDNGVLVFDYHLAEGLHKSKYK
jgi:hypothetical protein